METTSEIKYSERYDFSLDGVATLCITKISSTYRVIYKLHHKTGLPTQAISKELISENKEPHHFPLREISAKEISKYRKSEVPSFVLKIGSKLYYTEIPNISFIGVNLLGLHKCALSGMECRRLSAASDEEGGCAKVRNLSCNIERYPWIEEGFETFNTKQNAFCVTKCSHYEQCPPKKRTYSRAEIQEMRLGLAQYLWDDVESLSDLSEKLCRPRSFYR